LGVMFLHFRPSESDSLTIMEAFKEDLEGQLERILEDVIMEIKSEVRPGQDQDHRRYKRSLEDLDRDIAELQVEQSLICTYY